MNQNERMEIIIQRLCDSIRILEHNKHLLEDPRIKEIYCNIRDAMERIDDYKWHEVFDLGISLQTANKIHETHLKNLKKRRSDE